MRNSIPQLSNNKQQMLKEGVFTFNGSSHLRV